MYFSRKNNKKQYKTIDNPTTLIYNKVIKGVFMPRDDKTEVIMPQYYTGKIAKSDRIDFLKDTLYAKMPEIESDRAVLITESYKATSR